MAAAAVTTTNGVTNQFVTSPGLIGPGEDEKTGVVSTNSDTIYSSLWLDLSQGPLVISAPAMVPSDRFYVLPLLDMYTEQFASYGAVTTGTKAGSWVSSCRGCCLVPSPAVGRGVTRGGVRRAQSAQQSCGA